MGTGFEESREVQESSTPTEARDKPQIDIIQSLRDAIVLSKSNDDGHTKGNDLLPQVVLMERQESGAALGADNQPATDKGDGSVVVWQDDRVTDVTYPDNSTTHVEYDKAGKPMTVRESEEVLWQRRGEEWVKLNKDGVVTEKFKGEIEVSPEGEVTKAARDGSFGEWKRPGGETVTTRAGKDGRLYQVNSDSAGNVTDVSYPDKQRAHIEYEGGQVSSIAYSDKSSWTKDGDVWVKKDAEGKEVVRFEGDISSDKDGTIRIASKDGKYVESQSPDGAAQHLRDGTFVNRESNGDVTCVRYPDGKSAYIDFDKEHNPTMIRNPDQTIWQKRGQEWVLLDKQGIVTERFDGKFEISQDGSITRTSKDGTFTETTKPSGNTDTTVR